MFVGRQSAAEVGLVRFCGPTRLEIGRVVLCISLIGKVLCSQGLVPEVLVVTFEFGFVQSLAKEYRGHS